MARQKRSSRVSPDPVTAYAEAVIATQVVAGPLVRLACQRHLNDLANAKARGLVWNPVVDGHEGPEPVVMLALDFFPTILLLDNGIRFVPRDWQAFVAGSLFGWYRDDGTRRFRTGYVETGKGSGKTPLAAGIGLKGLIADRTESAEIYSAATDREQARICFLDAKRMVERSAELRGVIDTNVASLVYPKSSSVFRPLSSEHRGLDGKRVHMAILDELHEHPNALVADKMRAGTKKDPNALIFEITNSGYDRDSVCWQHREYSRQVLEGTVENDSWFAYICVLDEGDDWHDEAVWPKVNPSLPELPGYAYLREQVREAEGMPSKENIVKRLNFCIWTEQSSRWIKTETWDANAGDVPDEDLVGRTCFGGLDLSSTADITAFVLVFPLDDGRFAMRCWFWLPEDSARKESAPIRQWIDRQFIHTTPGNIVDYAWIRRTIVECGSKYRVQEVAFDRWNATHLVTELREEDGANMVEMGQGFASMSAPSKEFERLLLAGNLLHGGHPVLKWMAGNVAAKQDPAGNIKPDKGASGDRIDGIVALIMALGRAQANLMSSGIGVEFF